MSRPRRGTALWGVLAPAVFGLGWFLFLGGRRALNPTNVEWAMIGDWSSHVDGWLFFRQEPWGFPLGHLTRLFYPGGNTIGYTDSIPWVGILLKPFSGWMPVDFQYFGPWLGLCFAGLGAAGALVARQLSARPWIQALAGALFALTPVVAYRIVHPALCGHALLVLLIALHARPYADAAAARRGVAAAGGLLLFACGVHPYLAVMVLVLALALLVRLRAVDGLLSGRGALLAAAGYVLGSLGVFWLLGYLGQGVSTDVGGFGVYSADLLTLFDPQGFSRWIPSAGHRDSQTEGIGYLGLGVLLANLLAAATLLGRFRRARELPWARLAPLAVACALLALYSLSGDLTWRGHTVANLSALYRPFGAVVGPFRSSGRFIWPLHYLLYAAPVLVLVKLWADRPWVAGAALLGCVALQAAELNPERDRTILAAGTLQRLEAPAWSQLPPDYLHLAMYPGHIAWTNCSTPRGYQYPVLEQLTYLAYRRHLTFNSGYSARSSPAQVAQCLAATGEVSQGRLDSAHRLHHRARAPLEAGGLRRHLRHAGRLPRLRPARRAGRLHRGPAPQSLKATGGGAAPGPPSGESFHRVERERNVVVDTRLDGAGHQRQIILRTAQQHRHAAGPAQQGGGAGEGRLLRSGHQHHRAEALQRVPRGGQPCLEAGGAQRGGDARARGRDHRHRRGVGGRLPRREGHLRRGARLPVLAARRLHAPVQRRAEQRAHRARVGGAVLRQLLQRVQHHPLQRGGDGALGRHLPRRHWRAVEVGGEHLRRRARVERELPRQQLVEDAAQRVQVGPGGERIATALLRGHVLGGALHRAHLGEPRQPRVAHQRGQSEVEHLHPLAAVRLDDHQVGGLRSRWMMPTACAASSTSSTWHSEAHRAGHRPRSPRAAPARPRVPPERAPWRGRGRRRRARSRTPAPSRGGGAARAAWPRAGSAPPRPGRRDVRVHHLEGHVRPRPSCSAS